jgi:glycosyltransferase involved in cell wall biosynthesis
MSPPRILFLDQFGEMGGGQTVLVSLVQAALATGAAVTVLAPGGALQQALAARFGDAIAFVACAEPRLTHGRKSLADIGTLLAYGLRFRQYLPLLQRQNVIYLNGPRHLPHLLIYGLMTRARMFCHLHLDHSSIEKRLLRLAARWPTPFRLVANSRYVMTGIGARAGDVVLLENALDETFARLPFRNRFHDTSAPRTVAVIGTLRPEKGQDVAVKALTGRSDAVLHIIGRDGHGAEDWIRNLKSAAPSNILFDGETRDISGAMETMGIQFSLVPSRVAESFGLSAIESMACSCITIVSGRGGLAEISERTGALVAPDASTLAQALERLYALPPETLREIAQAQHDAALRHYHPDRFLSEATALFAAALKHSLGPQPANRSEA